MCTANLTIYNGASFKLRFQEKYSLQIDADGIEHLVTDLLQVFSSNPKNAMVAWRPVVESSNFRLFVLNDICLVNYSELTKQVLICARLSGIY